MSLLLSVAEGLKGDLVDSKLGPAWDGSSSDDWIAFSSGPQAPILGSHWLRSRSSVSLSNSSITGCFARQGCVCIRDV